MNFELKILSWNCNSMTPSRHMELEDFMRCNSVSIVAISEGKSNTLKPVFGYQQIRVSDDLHCYVIDDIRLSFRVLLIHHEPFCDALLLSANGMYLMFAYLRDGSHSHGINTLVDLINENVSSSDPLVVMGDLNARSVLAGNKRGNPAGKVIDRLLDAGQYAILNDGQMTFHRNNRQPSLLDLCICTNAVLPKVCDCVTLRCFDSDHYPLLTTLSSRFVSPPLDSSYDALYTVRACNVRAVPLEFKEKLDLEISASVAVSVSSHLDSRWRDLEHCVVQALNGCRLLRRSNGKPRKPWFTAEIRDLIRRRNQFKTGLLKAEVQKAIRRAKYDQWIHFVSSIDAADSISEVWSKFQISRGKPATLCSVGDFSITVNEIAQQFKTFSTPEIPRHPGVDRYISQHLSPVSLSEDLCIDINRPFSKVEVASAISECSNSAPGPDGIAYTVYKQFPDSALQLLTDLYNQCFDQGELPRQFQHCLQYALPKDKPGDFRPITLSNAVLKIYERLLYSRLQPGVDPVLPPWQFGFRPKRGAHDQLLRFVSTLQSARGNGKGSAVLFLDIKKAFDRVDIPTLLADLHETGIRGKCLRAIQCILAPKCTRVLLGKFLSDPYFPDQGTPQGGILSPLLWNFYFRRVADAVKSRADPEYFGFADDMAIVVHGTCRSEALTKLIPVYKAIRDYASFYRVQFSDSKVKCMYIAPRGRKRPREDGVEGVLYENVLGKVCRVELVKEYKYLGAIIDDGLTFHSWCSKVKDEVLRRTMFIQRLSKTGRLSRYLTERLYVGYVRGYLNYGAPVWSHAKTADQIHIADRRGLRLCCGALLRTSTLELIKESSIVSLDVHLKRMNLCYVHRVLTTPELTLVRQFILDSPLHTFSRALRVLWDEYYLPLVIESHESLSVLCTIRQVLVPRNKFDKHKYFGDFWKEKLLARIRMGVLPTECWAQSMRLCDSDVCRHCHSTQETIVHLFENCPALNYSQLIQDLQRLGMTGTTWEFIRERASMTTDPCFSEFCRAVFLFVKTAKLFANIPQQSVQGSLLDQTHLSVLPDAHAGMIDVENESKLVEESVISLGVQDSIVGHQDLYDPSGPFHQIEGINVDVNNVNPDENMGFVERSLPTVALVASGGAHSGVQQQSGTNLTENKILFFDNDLNSTRILTRYSKRMRTASLGLESPKSSKRPSPKSTSPKRALETRKSPAHNLLGYAVLVQEDSDPPRPFELKLSRRSPRRPRPPRPGGPEVQNHRKTTSLILPEGGKPSGVARIHLQWT